MRTRSASCGFSILELAVVLLVLAVAFGMAVPPLGRAYDRYATEAARDALASTVARVRSVAIARGGASLVVEPREGRCWIEDAAGRTSVPPLELARRFGVALAVDGAADGLVVLRFDALGLGRMANRTFRLRRGRSEARLTTSTYGRVRRW